MTVEVTREQSVLERVIAARPKRALCLNAVDVLDDPAEIRKFMAEYAEWVSMNILDDTAWRHPIEVAGYNICLALSYSSEPTRTLWREALEAFRSPEEPLVSAD